ncbi:MAG: hypothetical protein IAA81_10515 [Spirochaetes bacterium]|uniref:Uncharacterized protein n=1 Tax=Candidatus Gallitreponema excrementavium TaxID=2840840 RepID=A0A9D9HRT8_9SPIR|nr:hypothetical protein [Candidatus Gallitreponema excrementavium]
MDKGFTSCKSTPCVSLMILDYKEVWGRRVDLYGEWQSRLSFCCGFHRE